MGVEKLCNEQVALGLAGLERGGGGKSACPAGCYHCTKGRWEMHLEPKAETLSAWPFCLKLFLKAAKKLKRAGDRQ